MYVLNQYGGTVSVIDPGTNTVTATIEVGNFPEGAICLPDGSAVYVPNHFTRTVSVIDTDTNTVTATVTVGDGPRFPVALPDGSAVYMPSLNDETVSVIDASTNTVTARVRSETKSGRIRSIRWCFPTGRRSMCRSTAVPRCR